VMDDEKQKIRNFVRSFVGQYPNDLSVYEECFRHRSVGGKSNERLECLGDAVIGMIACEFLFKRYPDVNEGMISRLRVKIVNGAALGEYAKTIQLESMLKINCPHDHSSKIYEDAFEAFIGALYLDFGYNILFKVCSLMFTEHFDEDRLWKDSNYKDILNKLQKKMNFNVRYERVSQVGPSHDIKYVVCVHAGKEKAVGTGRTIKLAEQQASMHVLKQLGVTSFRLNQQNI
jgi:ribonuclease III